MFNNILVTLDGSELAENVLLYLHDLVPKLDSKLHVLGVCIGPERGLARPFEIYLEKIASEFQAQKIKAKAALAHGNPPDEILKYAEKNKIDLIAMTTSGRGGITRWLLGSTAEKVVRETKTAVLLVRGKRPSGAEATREPIFSCILVPLDGSEIGEAALSCAEVLATKIKSSVTLLHVIPCSYRSVNELEYPGPYPEEAISNLRVGGRVYLDGVCKKLKEKGVEVSYEVTTGDPAERILGYSKEKKFNLIAMSSHGRGGIARWALGSVADKVIRGSDVPVWMVRAPGVTCARP